MEVLVKKGQKVMSVELMDKKELEKLIPDEKEKYKELALIIGHTAQEIQELKRKEMREPSESEIKKINQEINKLQEKMKGRLIGVHELREISQSRGRSETMTNLTAKLENSISEIKEINTGLAIKNNRNKDYLETEKRRKQLEIQELMKRINQFKDNRIVMIQNLQSANFRAKQEEQEAKNMHNKVEELKKLLSHRHHK